MQISGAIMSDRSKRRQPSSMDDLVASVLDQAGLTERIRQASVIPEWPKLVGPQIASVTEPVLLQPDGTLVVTVRTHAWMQELTLLEPELMRSLNSDHTRPPIIGLRWILRR